MTRPGIVWDRVDQGLKLDQSCLVAAFAAPPLVQRGRQARRVGLVEGDPAGHRVDPVRDCRKVAGDPIGRHPAVRVGGQYEAIEGLTLVQPVGGRLHCLAPSPTGVRAYERALYHPDGDA